MIENLIVEGVIATSAKYAAGIAGNQYGYVIIRNCRSSVTIQSSVNGDGTHGGFVGVKGSSNSSGLYIEGCVFDGKIVSTGTNPTTRCGGFVGWTGANGLLSITNSLYAPTAGMHLTLTDTSATKDYLVGSMKIVTYGESASAGALDAVNGVSCSWEVQGPALPGDMMGSETGDVSMAYSSEMHFTIGQARRLRTRWPVDWAGFLLSGTAYFPVACIDHVLLNSYYTLSLLFVKIYLSRQ